MLFTLSKVLTALLLPSSVSRCSRSPLGFGFSRAGTRRRLGAKLAIGGLAYLVIAGIVPVGNALILPLEQHFAGVERPKAEDRIDGIIILGGFEDGWVSAGRGGLAVERIRRAPDGRPPPRASAS